MHAATTEIATCIVVAFWWGTRRRDSSMSRSDAAPPRLIGVAHDERAENVGAAGDLVGHDADARLQIVIAPRSS